MHFSIPDTQLFNVNGSSYMGYNIHINGAFHCTLRFRQLHCLHEQLRKEFSNRLPSFPPKKLLPLSLTQLEDRRSQLERYLQLVGQDSVISKNHLLNNFLLRAQYESSSYQTHIQPNSQLTTLYINLPHGSQKKLQIKSTLSTQNILVQICSDLTLPNEYRDNFTLYIARVLKDGDLELIRRLENFEAPCLSLRLCDEQCGVFLRRACWNPEMDERVLSDEIASGLLYVQAVCDVERGWLVCDNEIRTRLDELQKGGFSKEYLELARSQPHYGGIRFRPCPCDYPAPGSLCSLTLGPRALYLSVIHDSGDCTSSGNVIGNTNGVINKETAVFPVTRVRCWRLTTVHANSEDDTSSSTSSDSTPVGDSSTSTDTTPSQSQSHSTKSHVSMTSRLEFAFEYLVSRDNLRWVTVSSHQAALMSATLQSVVDELVVRRQGIQNTQQINDLQNKSTNWSYLNRDGGFIKFQENNSTITNSNNGTKDKDKDKERDREGDRRNGTKYSSVLFQSQVRDSVQNEAFENIGDDDL